MNRTRECVRQYSVEKEARRNEGAIKSNGGKGTEVKESATKRIVCVCVCVCVCGVKDLDNFN